MSISGGGGRSRMFGSAVLVLSFLLFVAEFPQINCVTLNLDNFRDVSIGRNLLQAKQACPVNFEFVDYSNLTSQCRGPTFPPKACCGAFVVLACPYAEYLNDLNTNCADTLFSYINLHGNYPPGLFSQECKDSKRGLECPDNIKRISLTSAGWISSRPDAPLLLMLSAGFFAFALRLF